MIHQDRVKVLHTATPARGSFVLYWMQASQRAHYNHALEYAIEQANTLALPVGVLFCLTDDYPDANLRHYSFMLEGLRSTVDTLAARGISTLIVRRSPVLQVPRVARRAALVVTDHGYLRHQIQWRSEMAERLDCPFVRVETDAIVPVDSASPKAEYSAATLRPKLGRILLRYLVPILPVDPVAPPLQFDEASLDPSDMDAILAASSIDTGEAEKRLATFLDEKLEDYERLRSNPATQYSSGLSPYLHFGQISPLFVALQVRDHGGHGAEAFLEELIIRRELSINFVHYNARYDSFAALPDWARKTLSEHEADTRPYVYDLEVLERAPTGTPPNWRWCTPARCTTTCGCTGARRLLSGRRRLPRLIRERCI